MISMKFLQEKVLTKNFVFVIFLLKIMVGSLKNGFTQKVILMLPMTAEQPEKQMYIGLKKKQ